MKILRKKLLFMISMLLLATMLAGCVAEVPVGPGPAGCAWIPAHYGPRGYWVPGHWGGPCV